MSIIIVEINSELKICYYNISLFNLRSIALKKIIDKYEKRAARFRDFSEKLCKTADRLSNIRLAVFVAGLALVIFLCIAGLYYFAAAGFIIWIGFFLYLIVLHTKVINNRDYAKVLFYINKDSIKRVNGEWIGFEDNGEDFSDNEHNYSNDLDIFGKGSLFQLINTAKTYLGRKALYSYLAEGPDTLETIFKRQQAISELSGKTAWRQRFQSEALMASKAMKNPDTIINWAEKYNDRYTGRQLFWLVRLLPIFTCVSFIISLSSSFLPLFIPAATLLIQLVMLRIGRKERIKALSIAAGYRDDIKVYSKMIERMEKQKFKSPMLSEMIAGMSDAHGKMPSFGIDKLSKIVSYISLRHSDFYLIFNLFSLWDYQNMVSLERWKVYTGINLKNWFAAIGKFEALSSLALIRHDHPEWAVPEIFDKGQVLETKGMGHPLLGEERVCNDLGILKPAKVLLITGSNMSGKSTLLRTTGINLVLAYAGAPVCAGYFKCSIMNIYTCMRISDNLGKNISSFYAELLRIKTIVKAASRGESIFFLLDEIFKGTNSKDRHEGARVLIKKLGTTNSIGLVSTHDLELCDLETSNDVIRNYHFREYYKDDKIYFDYKLRTGVSDTRNATYLMRMAGIDI